MITMPWYMSPDITCKVLNRIANRHPVTDLQNLVRILDYATELLWHKQEQFCQREATVKKQDFTP
jgi:predicted trehalose synthase